MVLSDYTWLNYRSRFQSYFSIFSLCRAKNQSEDGGGFLPPTPSSRAVRVPHFAPPTAQKLLGQNPERKTLFPFSKEISPPRQIRNARSVFSFGVSAESARR